MTTEDLMKLAESALNAQTGYCLQTNLYTLNVAKKARQELLDALEALGREVARVTESLRYEVDCVAAIGGERDTLSAELAAIRAQEPVGWFVDVTVHGKSVGNFQLAAREHWGDYSVCVPLYASPADKDAGLVADGWMLVPMEPTPQMIDAGQDVEDLYRRGTPDTWGKVYRAMLAASPKIGGV